jgi:hypothetical protein
MSLVPEDLSVRIDRIAGHLDEARAAVALLAEDPSAMRDLDTTVDALASAVADLKAQTASGGMFG